MQRKNAAKAHEATYDRSACGTRGGISRAGQFTEAGMNSAGHRMWDIPSLAKLQILLNDPDNYYTSVAHRGKPIIPQIVEKFNDGMNGNSRTSTGIRIKIRRLLEEQEKA